MKNIVDLRTELFDTWQRIKNAKGAELEEEMERAKVIANISKTIVTSAKIEVAYMALSGYSRISDFFDTGLAIPVDTLTYEKVIDNIHFAQRQNKKQIDLVGNIPESIIHTLIEDGYQVSASKDAAQINW